MGHIVPLHHPVRLLEEIALTDQLTGGRIEVGLVPGIVPSFFEPFKADFEKRREVTLEFARFMKAAYAGDGHVTWNTPAIPYGDFDLSVMPLQRPHRRSGWRRATLQRSNFARARGSTPDIF